MNNYPRTEAILREPVSYQWNALLNLCRKLERQLSAAPRQPEARPADTAALHPLAWIATNKERGEVMHFAVAHGWDIQVVLEGEK